MRGVSVSCIRREARIAGISRWDGAKMEGIPRSRRGWIELRREGPLDDYEIA